MQIWRKTGGWMVWKFQHTEGRLGIVTRLGPNWRNEYFFPVILLSFPVIENFFPVIVWGVFDQKPPWTLGFRDFGRQFMQMLAFFPVFFPVIGILPNGPQTASPQT